MAGKKRRPRRRYVVVKAAELSARQKRLLYEGLRRNEPDLKWWQFNCRLKDFARKNRRLYIPIG